MNLFDKAFQHLGFSAADFSSTAQYDLPNDGVRCVSTLVYDKIECLDVNDWRDNMEAAVQMVNHDLNKSINEARVDVDRTGKGVTVTIEVYR